MAPIRRIRKNAIGNAMSVSAAMSSARRSVRSVRCFPGAGLAVAVIRRGPWGGW